MKRFYCLKITLKGVHRPIWRRFVVPSNIPLGEFHDVLQTIMGWMNSHLHAFEVGNARSSIQSYKTAQWIEPDWDDSLPEEEYTLEMLLTKKGAKITYLYDFGDYWQHEILLENPDYDDPNQPAPIFCIKGVGACPPEDCGSTFGFEEFCEAMANSKHPEYKTYQEWYGGKYDPEHFDLDGVNEGLGIKRQAVPTKKVKKKVTKKGR
jgi:hypothetical protein